MDGKRGAAHENQDGAIAPVPQVVRPLTHTSGSTTQRPWRSPDGWLRERAARRSQAGRGGGTERGTSPASSAQDCHAFAAAVAAARRRSAQSTLSAPKRLLTVHLGREATAAHAHAHVEGVEAVGAEEKHGLEHLGAERLGLHKGKGHAVDAQDTLALLHMGDGHGATLRGGRGARREGKSVVERRKQRPASGQSPPSRLHRPSRRPRGPNGCGGLTLRPKT